MAAKFVTYANGGILSVKAVAENTAAATSNVNGIGAKSSREMLSRRIGAQRAELQPAAGLCRRWHMGC
ncbi:hypothetical protein NKH80_07685 [Mesorhizobium sp. M0904]|uniref:hypothetical protein n=1 Tax=unclassified Mesorhizobium TaxID=325217 RepID=UPI00333813FA